MNEGKLKFTGSTSFFIDAIGIVVIFMVLKELQSIFIPLLIAYFLFFVFSPLNAFLGKYKIPLSALVILDLLIIIFLFGGITSVIIDSFSRFAEQLPQYELKFNNIVSSTALSLGVKDPKFTNFQVAKMLKDIDLGLIAGNLFSSTFSFLGTLLFVIFFFIFVVTGQQNIYNAISNRYYKKKQSNNSSSLQQSENILKNTFKEITDQVQRYVITKFLTSVLNGLSVGIILWIFRVDFLLVWAAFAFLLNFIPVVGSIIAVALPALMALVQFESVSYALLIALIVIVVQNIIGNFLEPKIFGNKLGLNPLVILLSLLLWGYIWGIVGILLSIPLTAIIKIIISRSDSPNLNLLNDFMSS
ncbi:MAG: AI-2E family transporter [Ignavibacteriales bacterium]|nr:MAG: AI-2E family transporter [Ignavibacteriales bacterium]